MPDLCRALHACSQQAADYVKALGAKDGMRGPASLSAYDEWGLLIDGFMPPVLLIYGGARAAPP